ncbi:MAG: redoxin domain-containing protein [Clostridia bacterium]|nr:redoxin domain-containing protein [Clostridia bacterium]
MNNKKTLLILSLVFVLLIGGASALYAKLGQSLAPDQLAVQATQPKTEAAATSTPEAPQTESEQATPTPASPQQPESAQATPEVAGPPQPKDEQSDTTAEEPMLAPDFTVYDAEGNEVHLSDFFGKPIVLNFWASWCGPCKMEMPDFHEKYLELGEEIHFLMVNMTDGARETVEVASAFIEKNAFTFPVFYDTAVDAAMTYGVYSLPTTYFINAEGHPIAQATGAISADTLQRGIDMIK